MSHPDVEKYSRAVAEHEIREFADELGYRFQSGPQGVIVLIPPNFDPLRVQYAEPRPGAAVILGVDVGPAAIADRDRCADCGMLLDVFNRCQIPADGGLAFYCTEHYAARTQ